METKTERNSQIVDRYELGYSIKKIAQEFKLSLKRVQVIISRDVQRIKKLTKLKNKVDTELTILIEKRQNSTYTPKRTRRTILNTIER